MIMIVAKEDAKSTKFMAAASVYRALQLSSVLVQS